MKTNPADLEGALKTIETSWIYQDINNDVYYKCLIQLAAGFATDCFDIETALILVNRIPPDFFDGLLQSQMAEDKFLANAAIDLAHRFSQMILQEAAYETNQPAAEA